MSDDRWIDDNITKGLARGRRSRLLRRLGRDAALLAAMLGGLYVFVKTIKWMWIH